MSSWRRRATACKGSGIATSLWARLAVKSSAAIVARYSIGFMGSSNPALSLTPCMTSSPPERGLPKSANIEENIEVHHIRKLADLNVEGRPEKPAWVKRMAARRRKTLVVCQDCHDAIHTGRPTRQFSRTGHRRAT